MLCHWLISNANDKQVDMLLITMRKAYIPNIYRPYWGYIKYQLYTLDAR